MHISRQPWHASPSELIAVGNKRAMPITEGLSPPAYIAACMSRACRGRSVLLRNQQLRPKLLTKVRSMPARQSRKLLCSQASWHSSAGRHLPIGHCSS